MGFYRTIDLIRREFRVITIDFIGMGASGRPPYRLKTARDSQEYFIHQIEAWFRQSGIEKAYFMSHSFGGFMTIHFALRYPHRCQKLVLLSPVGIP